MTDALRLGLVGGGGNHQALRMACERFGLAAVIPAQRLGTPGQRVYSNDEVFVENSTYTSRRFEIKRRLIGELGVASECAICCNPGDWLGQPLSLQLDHVNGISNDNRRENLRLLCPNCHAQTDTFTGRRKRRTCPKGCGTQVAPNARRCRGCRAWLDRPLESGRASRSGTRPLGQPLMSWSPR